MLQVIHALEFGGAERVLVKLALAADPERFDMSVCCIRTKGPLAQTLVDRGIQVELAGPSGRLHNLVRPVHLRRVIARLRPHVVHTHGLPALSETGPLRMLGLAPHWVHTYHYGNYPYTARRHHMPVERFFSRFADQLVAVSDKQRETVIEYHRLDPSRIVTVTNGVQPNAIVSDPAVRAARRAELGLPADATVVGTVAVLTEQKGVTHLLRAAQELRRVRPDVRLLVVGGGALEQDLRQQAAALGIDDVVTFTGWRNDAADLLCTFDVFVMSSLWEAMPVALLEAMSARLPVVATDVGQNRAILQHEAGGLIVPPADHGAIASAVGRLLEQPALAAAMAAHARRRVEDHYTVAHMVRRYEALYERGAGLAPAPAPSAEMERS